MKCPFCGFADSKVADSRSVMGGTVVKRRRECISCKRKFTTFETVENKTLTVVKRDKTKEDFNRSKLSGGISRACINRPVTSEQIEEVVDEVEQLIIQSENSEYPSSLIGDHVMKRLKEIDEVSYVRFVSVYKKFDNVDTFMKEIKNLKE